MGFRSQQFIALLALWLLAAAAGAQEAEEETPPPPPEIGDLQADWWSFFEGQKDQVAPRIEAFLSTVNARVAELQPANQAVADPLLAAIRENFSAYLALLGESEPQPQALPEPPISYSLDEFLELARESREARARAADEQLEVEREQRILDGTRRG